MNHQDILEGLGFNLEQRNDSAGWERWRHKLAPKHDQDFALIVYNDYDMDDTMEIAANMLRKIGQYQKIQQLTQYID